MHIYDLPMMFRGPVFRPRLLAYITALAATLGTLAIHFSFGTSVGHHPMMVLFILPIVISAYLGGLGPGLLALGLSCGLLLYLLVPPQQSFHVAAWGDLVHLGLFALSGLLISLLSEHMHRVQKRVRDLYTLREQVAEIAEHLPGVIFSFQLHPDGRACFPYSSNRLQQMFDLDDETMKKDAQPLFDRIPEPDRSELLQSIQRSARELSPWHRVFRYQHGQRGEIWIDGRSRPTRHASGVVEWHGFATDVTELKKAERAASGSEQLLKDIMNAAKAIIWVKDLNGRFLTINQYGAEIIGRPPPEIIGHTVRELFPDTEATQYETNDRQAMESGRAVEFEETALRPDGQHIYLSSKFPLRDPDGHVYGLAALCADITDTRRIEDRLRHQELLMREAGDLAHVGGWEFDPATGQGHWTAECARIHEVDSVSTLTARKGLSFFRGEHLERIQKAMHDAMERGTPYDLELEMVTARGNLKWVRTICHPILDKGKVIRMRGALQDITERKQAEELLRRQSGALEAAANAIVITDHQGTILWVNPAFSKISGYAETEALGKNPRDLMKSGAQDADFYRVLWSTITSGKVWQGEIINRRKDGKVYHEEMTITPIRDDQGAITHYVAIKQDITERKSMEAQLLRTQRLESVGRLASGIAHDLNNILTPVLLAPAILREVIQEPTVRSIIDSVEKNAQRGADIVRQLLTFGRGLESVRSPMPLRALIRDMVKIMNETFPRNITVRTELTPDMILIDGDPTQLHQLLMNLCVNARDAMPEGGHLTIRLEASMIEADQASIYPWVLPGPHALLTVTDTGTGIPKEHLDKIYDPFFTTKPPGEGTGLGLSTALGIVRSHRGFIEVESWVGQGTTFRIFLPQSATATYSTEQHTLEPLVQGNGQRVLVVDDEASVRNVIGEILKRNGYQVDFARHGREAWELVEKNPDRYQAVITDLMMPVMDGWALIKALRAHPPVCKIITLSGYLPQPDWMDQARALTDGVLVKPCAAEDLLNLLNDLLNPATP
jgi:two-component system cell cycle sensor histidine kinase/response regulator CckA